METIFNAQANGTHAQSPLKQYLVTQYMETISSQKCLVITIGSTLMSRTIEHAYLQNTHKNHAMQSTKQHKIEVAVNAYLGYYNYSNTLVSLLKCIVHRWSIDCSEVEKCRKSNFEKNQWLLV
jgi:ABC-type nickel/cobalt efflux system permease component RcnA